MYLQEDELPADPKLVKRLVADWPRFDIVELYYENPDVPGRWRIAVKYLREILLKEAHSSRTFCRMEDLRTA